MSAPGTPADRRLWQVLLAAVLVVLALVAVLAQAPAAVRAPLSLLALAGTAARLARHRRRGGVDAVLVATGLLLVTLVLTGLLLGVSGVGLRAATWAVALAVVGLIALAVSALRPPVGRVDAGAPERSGGAPRRRGALLLAPWVVASAAVTVVALVIAVRSASEAEVAPVQMSLSALEGPRAQIVVSASEASGPLELRTDPGDGSAVTYPLFSVPADGSVTTSVLVPTSGRVVVTISNPGQVQPLRTLVVNR